MRAKYNNERSVSLQRMFPETAKVGVRKTRSNGRGGPRVFHTMLSTAIRTPMVITDRDLYASVTLYLEGLGKEFSDLRQKDLRARVNKRAARWG